MNACPCCGREPVTGRALFDALAEAGCEPKPYMHANEVARIDDDGREVVAHGFEAVTLDAMFNLEQAAARLNTGRKPFYGG